MDEPNEADKLSKTEILKMLGISEELCPNKNPEPHHLGEFSMSCFRCHIYADS